MANGLPDEAPRFLDQRATAAFLGLSDRTLERFRLDGNGPEYRKFGRRVLYEVSDILLWAERQKRASTSEATVPQIRQRDRR
jgi:predicted DNA-binding transcriptional regulator AlpA